MDRRALLVVNPRSRVGQAFPAELTDVLAGAGIRAELVQPANPEEAERVIRERGPDADMVIVGGGDGTLNQLADALVDTDRPCGLLPMGTANDLARTLGIPIDPLAAAAVIAAGRLHPIDLGRVNGRLFFNVASIGLSVQVTEQISPTAKRHWGIAGYLSGVIRGLRRSGSFRVALVCDGKPHRLRALQVAVGNGRHFGGGFTVAAEARIDDELLDVNVIRPQGLSGLLTLVPELRRGPGGNGKERTLLLRCRTADVATERPMRIDTDGELTATTPAHFDVLPGALRFYVPEPPGEGVDVP